MAPGQSPSGNLGDEKDKPVAGHSYGYQNELGNSCQHIYTCTTSILVEWSTLGGLLKEKNKQAMLS